MADTDHVVPVSTYLAVFGALMVLTLVTVAASRVDLGLFNAPVAVAIALVKATLVVLFFMHVKYSGKLIGLVLAAAVFWLFHLMAGTVADYASRGRVNPQGRPPEALVLEDR